jgi:NitT/TauT family transport system substrate-binding protein
MTSRHFLGCSLTFLLGLAACGGATPASPSAPASAAKPAAPASSLTKVTAAYSTISASSYFDWIAEDAGLYRKHGVDLDLQFLSPASTTAALLSGNVDLATSSPGNVAAAVAKGADLVMIAAGHEGPTQAIVARTGINSIKDLRGKKVAATQRGATTDLMMRDLAKEQGFGPDDVTIVYIPESSAQVAALTSGAVDAAVLSDPGSSVAVTQGGHVIYGPDQDTGSRFVNLSTVTLKRSYLASHRELLKQYLMADMEAIHLMKTQPDEALQYVKSRMKIDDTKVLRSSSDNILKITNPDLSFSMKSLQTVLDTTAVTAPDVAKLKPQDLVDLSLIEEIKASGFLQSLAPAPASRPS